MATTSLFVYGTLMSTATNTLGADVRARLALSSRHLGPATLQGLLYDLGAYPGAVENSRPGAVVHGEIVALNDAAATFVWLDAYEGITPGNPDPEYVRRVAPVRLADGRDTSAWVYLYGWPISHGRLITDGRWASEMA